MERSLWIMTEYMVPRDLDVVRRIEGFYQEIGWETRTGIEGERFIFFHPPLMYPPSSYDQLPAYWQTENPTKQGWFEQHDSDEPSRYARGLRLPRLHDLVEVCLVLPSNEKVHSVFELGGALLEAHTHIRPRLHGDGVDFRFADPFNYSVRVTSDPGWDIKPLE